MIFSSVKRKFKNRMLSTWMVFYQYYLSKIIIKKIEPNHCLRRRLIVSITSYPPRFKSLHLSVICLLRQTTKPDAIILWIAENDIDKLPYNVRKLKKYGLKIKKCEDYKSFKKIIPALKEYPDAFIVTADDDLYYWSTWLEELVLSYISKPTDVICHRAHRILLDDQGTLLPYSDWSKEISFEEESINLFPTSGAGVLYSPAIFYDDAIRNDIFMRLAPTSDDVWLYWMHSLTGSSIRTLGAKKLTTWLSSQVVSLYSTNCGDELMNDFAIKNMCNKYGYDFLK